MKKSKGKVWLVGAGPGDPGLITVKGFEVLREADVVIHDRLVPPALLAGRPGVRIVYAGKKAYTVPGHNDRRQARIHRLMEKYAKAGLKVVRLKGGDPFVFGRGGEEMDFLESRKISYEIVPGITAGVGVPAYAGIPVTDRRFASAVTFVTARGGKLGGGKIDWKALASDRHTLVIFMGARECAKVMRELKAAGLPEDLPVVFIEQGTLSAQRESFCTLGTFEKKIGHRGLRPPVLAVAGAVLGLRKKKSWFCRKPLHGRTVLITRPEKQAGTLASLLREQGARVLEYAAIRIAPSRDFRDLDRAIGRLSSYDWLIFTSANGVHAFFERLRKCGRDARALAGSRIAVIGKATAVCLRNYGLEADLLPETATSEGLLKSFRKGICVPRPRILLLQSEQAPSALGRELRALGAKADRVDAYRTLIDTSQAGKLREWIRAEPIDAVVFTSASTVESFFRIVSPAEVRRKKIRLISIGPRTSKAVRRRRARVWREARRQDLIDLCKDLCRRLGAREG
ncbi:MAG: uroporphyrinogen-III C-methyltransferase [Candidatus Omnitrophota bacterium]